MSRFIFIKNSAQQRTGAQQTQPAWTQGLPWFADDAGHAIDPSVYIPVDQNLPACLPEFSCTWIQDIGFYHRGSHVYTNSPAYHSRTSFHGILDDPCCPGVILRPSVWGCNNSMQILPVLPHCLPDCLPIDTCVLSLMNHRAAVGIDATFRTQLHRQKLRRRFFLCRSPLRRWSVWPE